MLVGLSASADSPLYDRRSEFGYGKIILRDEEHYYPSCLIDIFGGLYVFAEE